MDISNLLAKRTIVSILVLFSIFQNTCFAEISINQVIKNAPQNVLVGTDVKLLNSFKLVGHISSGQYAADIGGANLSIEIHADETSLNITRVFQEPGLAKDSKHYEFNKVNKSYINNSEILLVLVKRGVLLLEKKSGSFGIPADIWILYKQ